MPDTLRAQVLARAGGRCDCCGVPLGGIWDAHHRKLRSRGGQDTLENLVALTHGHHMRVHENPAASTASGFMVPSWADPAEVPIFRHGLEWVQPVGAAWRPAAPIRSEVD